jgi:glycosyltransferase involved in cell wall biosynthesis
LPARYEPFGLSVLEAALAGCALVLGDIPSLRENWDGAAVFVDPSNDSNLSTVLCSLIENDAFRNRWACRARVRALEFTVAGMADGYLSIYESLLACRGPRHRFMEAPACAS